MQKKVRKHFLLVLGMGLVFTLGFVFLLNNYASSRKPVVYETPELLMDRANYLNYSEQNFSSSRKLGRSVLFFAATSWCNTCSDLDKELKKKSNLLPPDVTVLKVDYDNEAQMKNKYNIMTQHTIVVLDMGGNELIRWVGGDLGEMIRKLESV